MKLWVLVNTKHFQAYLEQGHLVNSPDTFQQYLREIGTSFLTFQTPSKESTDYIEVPSGSCIRLRTEDEYKLHAHDLRTKEDKSERTTSCTIV
jgi:hypothetical protein